MNNNKPRKRTGEVLESLLAAIKDIKTSGYIPFASPAPSSTEKVISESILEAEAALTRALRCHRQCYGRNALDGQPAPSLEESLRSLGVPGEQVGALAEKLKASNTGRPGTLIHGTHRNEDLIPVFLQELLRLDAKRYSAFYSENPEMAEAVRRQLETLDSPWWDSEDATETCVELIDILDGYAPEGHCFTTHPGDGSDFGYWPAELID